MFLVTLTALQKLKEANQDSTDAMVLDDELAQDFAELPNIPAPPSPTPLDNLPFAPLTAPSTPRSAGAVDMRTNIAQSGGVPPALSMPANQWSKDSTSATRALATDVTPPTSSNTVDLAALATLLQEQLSPIRDRLDSIDSRLSEYGDILKRLTTLETSMQSHTNTIVARIDPLNSFLAPNRDLDDADPSRFERLIMRLVGGAVAAFNGSITTRVDRHHAVTARWLKDLETLVNSRLDELNSRGFPDEGPSGSATASLVPQIQGSARTAADETPTATGATDTGDNPRYNTL